MSIDLIINRKFTYQTEDKRTESVLRFIGDEVDHNKSFDDIYLPLQSYISQPDALMIYTYVLRSKNIPIDPSVEVKFAEWTQRMERLKEFNFLFDYVDV